VPLSEISPYLVADPPLLTDPCFASTVTLVSLTTSVPTRRTSRCGFPTAARTFILPAFISILRRVVVSPRPACGIPSRRLYSGSGAPSCRAPRNGVWSASSSTGTTPASSGALHAATPPITMEDLKLRDLGTAVRRANPAVRNPCRRSWRSCYETLSGVWGLGPLQTQLGLACGLPE
jgi:hypothetical protein